MKAGLCRRARALCKGHAVALALVTLSFILSCSASTGDNKIRGSSFASAGGAGTIAGNMPGASGHAGNGAGAFGGVTSQPIISLDSGTYQPPGNGGAPVMMTTAAGGTPVTAPTQTATPPMPVSIDECPGPVSATMVQALKQGGSSSGLRLLYPYDKTVFPVGLLPPVFQWDGVGNADAVYIHMKSSLFEYTGCFGATTTASQTVSNTVWRQAGVQTGTASDSLAFEMTLSSGGTVYGPVKLTIFFAPGNLKGDLFYNTYTSPQANGNGAVMKLHLGDTKPEVFLTDNGMTPYGPCWSCHSLSANGAMLVAQHHQYPGGPYLSASFDLAANPAPSPPPKAQIPGTTAEMGMGAVYPDGSKVLTMGSPGDSTSNPLASFPDAPGNVPAMLGPKATMLLDTATGNQITLTGWNVQYAQMPSFSPDGSMIAFNWYDKSQGHTLAVANFDTSTNTVSNVRELFTHQTLFVGWPWITPDDKQVVFVLGNTQDYVSGYPGRIGIASSDLWIADVATGKTRQLARANGYDKDGDATYLPRPGRDEHFEFFPTISPIQAGGYFWLFFTSRRTYGNQITQIVDDAVTKKIWVSAIDIQSGSDLIDDPSNPPFYLPGQEDAAGNVRAFAALEPCHKDGESCETGIDCCNGHCYMGTCGLPPPPPPPPPGQPPPPPPPPACSNVDERCNTASDCCDSKASCISHFCVIIQPPH
ncbi:MAG TPA: hypothetical protein VHC69_17940 [Polyangiaceae bacterium]|nr:hypothetical protein [Polyangiaceae bacterium]